jgi:hypothetical protein
MSYQEKRTITNIFTGVVVLIAYCIHAFGKYQSGMVESGDLKFWASTMLIFIGIGIVVAIIVQIVFHILLSVSIAVQKKIQDRNFDEKEIEKTIQSEMVEDEMGKLIGLKSERIGYITLGAGLVLGLFAIVFNYSTAVFLNILFISFSLGSILEGFTNLYYFRRGIHNA